MAQPKRKRPPTARGGKPARPRTVAAMRPVAPVKEVAETETVPLCRGPRKVYKEGPRPPRVTNHKNRSVWFRARASWPLLESPVESVIVERGRARKSLAAHPGASWQSVGPTNIGGRLTSVVCDPGNPARIWGGAAGGGVWHSSDAGRNWQPQWHEQDVLNVGALAMDPRNANVLYCGTGEANLSADSYPGVGLLRTPDGGTTWKVLSASERTALPRRIGAIAVDPFDSRHVFVGGVGHRPVHDLGGLYESADGGVSWVRHTFISAQNHWCHAVVFHPTQAGTVFATFTEQGARSGLWRSRDGGRTWAQLKQGLPSPAAFHRTSLAISPSDPNVIYACAADATSEDADRLLGVFRSPNGGESWKKVSGNHFDDEGQMSYNNAIAVHPEDPDHVLCGGVDLHLTTNAGKTWRRVTRWDADRTDSNYAHADHHALLMPAGAAGRVYDANDGGLDVSEDGGRNWTNRSNGLAVTMFYDLDVAQSDGRSFGGGAQDNGTLVTTTGLANDHWELSGGDGGWIVYNPTDAGHVYTSSQFGTILRFRGGKFAEVTPQNKAYGSESGRVWMVFIAMDPKDRDTVYTGTLRLWRTKDDGKTWDDVSPVFDQSAITAINVARSDTQRLYVGTENGAFFRSRDGGQTWTPNLQGAVLPGTTVTRVESHPVNADVVVVTVANFGHSHVFRSDDGGDTWHDIDRGQLPDVPHHSAVIPADDPQTLYVCGDAGVFRSPDLGQTWTDVTRNLPNVMVVDMAYHRADGTLTAATYGRSSWRLKLRE
jgi:photosystem II stability/assembly factor-like uncharacterized protein